LDNEVSKRLAAAGVPVVGVSSRHFWSQPKREDVGKDMAPIAAVNQKRWKRTRFVLIGSSLGADVAPFMANHLDSLRAPGWDWSGYWRPVDTQSFRFMPVTGSLTPIVVRR
jgi:type IV secretory pathway VirJ component